jgi:hypothetical protein
LDGVQIRETREGRPLLTVETETNGDSKSTNELGPSLVDSSYFSCQYKSFCRALAALVGPIQNTFFLTVHYFNPFVPTAQQAVQAAVLDRLSLSMCLWLVLRTLHSYHSSFLHVCHTARRRKTGFFLQQFHVWAQIS